MVLGSRSFAWLAVLLALGCGRAPARSSADATRSPSAIGEAPALGPDQVSLGALRASCRSVRASELEAEQPLTNVDCSIERLTRRLKAEALAAGGDVIVARRCRVRGGSRLAVECSAGAAASAGLGGLPAASELPAPSPDRVADLDEPDPLAADDILLRFLPSSFVASREDEARAPSAPPRAYDRVADLAQLPLVDAELGQLSARCEACDERSLRHALRVGAGRLGASEIAEARCFREQSGPRCVAIAGGPWSY